MGQTPVNDADELGTALDLRRKPDLASSIGCCLQQSDLVAAFRRNAGCLQSCRAGANHHHMTLLTGRLGDNVGHGGLTSGCRVVNAGGAAAFVYTVQAIGCPDAGTYVVLAPVGHLGGDVRLGNVSPRHAHHVELAVRNCVPRGRDIVDAGSMEHRELCLSADLAGKIKVRGRRRAGDRNDP